MKRPMISYHQQRNILAAASLVTVAVLSPAAFAGPANLALDLSGSASQNNAGLESYSTSAGTAGVSIGLGEHFRVGVSYRRAFEKRKGLKEVSKESYLNFKSDMEQSVYSLDLTVILYSGRVSPYVFGGIANKYYVNKVIYDLPTPLINTAKYEQTEVPTYGFGFAIYLSQMFSLKISQTFSPGELQTPDENGQLVKSKPMDKYLQVGISYHIM